jgi:hypothetical protein
MVTPTMTLVNPTPSPTPATSDRSSRLACPNVADSLAKFPRLKEEVSRKEGNEQNRSFQGHEEISPKVLQKIPETMGCPRTYLRRTLHLGL